jgi:hypothetical protein
MPIWPGPPPKLVNVGEKAVRRSTHGPRNASGSGCRTRSLTANRPRGVGQYGLPTTARHERTTRPLSRRRTVRFAIDTSMRYLVRLSLV